MTPDELAQAFHEAYERLAPRFGYETRKASAKPWAEVPEQNRSLMVAVCAELLGELGEVANLGLATTGQLTTRSGPASRSTTSPGAEALSTRPSGAALGPSSTGRACDVFHVTLPAGSQLAAARLYAERAALIRRLLGASAVAIFNGLEDYHEVDAFLDRMVPPSQAAR